MNKWLYPAAAAAGGLMLLGASPAYADVEPSPGQQQPSGGQDAGGLGGLLDPAGGLDPASGVNLGGPLGGSPVVKVKPGQNSPDVTGVVPPKNGAPAARTGLGSSKPTDGLPAGGLLGGGQQDSALPPADVVGEDLPIGSAAGGPLGGLLGGLPLGGLLPDGGTPALSSRKQQESVLDGEDLPLFGGGLGGLLPGEPATTLPATDGVPDVSGMPPGGTKVTDDPAADKPATDPATTRDPRVHDDGTNGAPAASAGASPAPSASAPAAAGRPKQADRKFSDGRPVAGQDTEFK
jgi:hypothetical protein